MFLRYNCATVGYGRDRLSLITSYAKLTKENAADEVKPAEGINGEEILCLKVCIPVTV